MTTSSGRRVGVSIVTNVMLGPPCMGALPALVLGVVAATCQVNTGLIYEIGTGKTFVLQGLHKDSPLVYDP